MEGMGSVQIPRVLTDCRSKSWNIEWIDGGNKELITVI